MSSFRILHDTRIRGPGSARCHLAGRASRPAPALLPRAEENLCSPRPASASCPHDRELSGRGSGRRRLLAPLGRPMCGPWTYRPRTHLTEPAAFPRAQSSSCPGMVPYSRGTAVLTPSPQISLPPAPERHGGESAGPARLRSLRLPRAIPLLCRIHHRSPLHGRSGASRLGTFEVDRLVDAARGPQPRLCLRPAVRGSPTPSARRRGLPRARSAQRRSVCACDPAHAFQGRRRSPVDGPGLSAARERPRTRNPAGARRASRGTARGARSQPARRPFPPAASQPRMTCFAGRAVFATSPQPGGPGEVAVGDHAGLAG